MLDKIIVGLIGLGYDEDGILGFINPLMIDAKYLRFCSVQRKCRVDDLNGFSGNYIYYFKNSYNSCKNCLKGNERCYLRRKRKHKYYRKHR